MKNKKSIAMAMAAVSTLGAVAPAFANEITGNVVNDFNLDNLKSTNDQVRVKAEKDLEVTKAAIEELVNEVDTNGNKVYKATQSEVIEEVNGQKYSCVYVKFTSQDDVTNTVKHQFKFYKKVRLVGDTDQIFGQKLPWDTENKIIFNLDENSVFVYNEETRNVDKKIVSKSYEKAYAKLSKVIYELKKASSKVTVFKEEIEGENGYTVYTGKIGEDQKIDADKVARIDIIGDVKENLVTLVDANNDFLGHWAEDTIVDSMIADIIDNSATFRPEDSITRAEFAKVACKAFGLDEIEAKDYNGEFNDVAKSDWYVGYVATMAEAGYMKGDGNKTFRPEDKITREEAAVVIAQMHNELVKGNTNKVEQVTTDVNGNRVHKDTVTNFVDDEKIAVWADESVAYLVENGLSNGYTIADGTGRTEYKPANQINRAEAVVMMNRSVLKK